MQRVKEFTLNGLLVVLVALSILLSYRVWFPSDQAMPLRTKEAQVQSSAPPAESVLTPTVHRPERIYVQNKDGATALLPAGSADYGPIWQRMREVLSDLQPASGLASANVEVERTGESITLILPLSLMLGQWAQLWEWPEGALPSFSLKVDRLTVYLSKTPMVHFSGATGVVYRVGPLSAVDQRLLRDLVAGVDPGLFQKYRPLDWKDASAKIAAGLTVPPATEMPVGTLSFSPPDAAVEQARYFPDLSVVRHIEEKDASSFTDGQRWLRLTAGGQTEYAMAAPQGAPPDLTKSLDAAKAWVLAHGGWQQDLVLTEWVQQPYRSLLVYNLRLPGGLFPIETAGPSESNAGTLRLELTNRENIISVTQYRRYPEFSVNVTGPGRTPVVPAEFALQAAVKQFPSTFLFDGEVREMHLAYLLWQRDKLSTWRLEPTWMINVGEKRIYVPAIPKIEVAPFMAGA